MIRDDAIILKVRHACVVAATLASDVLGFKGTFGRAAL